MRHSLIAGASRRKKAASEHAFVRQQCIIVVRSLADCDELNKGSVKDDTYIRFEKDDTYIP